jgi:hypothetical protein
MLAKHGYTLNAEDVARISFIQETFNRCCLQKMDPQFFGTIAVMQRISPSGIHDVDLWFAKTLSCFQTVDSSGR